MIIKALKKLYRDIVSRLDTMEADLSAIQVAVSLQTRHLSNLERSLFEITKKLENMK